MSVARTPANFSTDQMDLFQQVDSIRPAVQSATAPDLDIELELLAALKQALREARNHGLSRERVVERINECLPEERHITLRQLNSWCAVSKEMHPLPAWVLPALCWALEGVISPLEVLTRAMGMHLIDEQELVATRIGRISVEKAALSREERQLKARISR